MNARANDVDFSNDAQRGQSLAAAHGSATWRESYRKHSTALRTLQFEKEGQDMIKDKFPIAECRRTADELCGHLAPVSERIIVAGSIRRNKPFCSDVEILYIGKTEVRQDPADMFASITVNLADEAIAALEKAGALERRKNVNGSEMYGPKNKLMRHRASGLPVDLFAATTENWWNYLVCRTGPADSNTRICMAAQDRGWKWNPYGAGFSKADASEQRGMASEREVFEFVGLPYKEPWNRT